MDLMTLVKQKRQQLQEASGQRVDTVKVDHGKSRWRILPTWRKTGNPEFWHDFGLHFIHGTTANEEGKTLRAVYVCTAKTYQRNCPICQAIADGLANAPNDEVIKALEQSRSRQDIYVNAIRRDGSSDEVVILELRPSVFRQILDFMDEYGDITHPKTGRDIVITKEGRGLNTKYTAMVAANSTEVNPAVLNNLHDLDAYVAREDKERELAALTAVRQNTAGALPAPASSAESSPPWEEKAPIEGEAVSEPADPPPPPASQQAAPEVNESDSSMTDDEVEKLLAGL